MRGFGLLLLLVGGAHFFYVSIGRLLLVMKPVPEGARTGVAIGCIVVGALLVAASLMKGKGAGEEKKAEPPPPPAKT